MQKLTVEYPNAHELKQARKFPFWMQPAMHMDIDGSVVKRRRDEAKWLPLNEHGGGVEMGIESSSMWNLYCHFFVDSTVRACGGRRALEGRGQRRKTPSQ